MSFVVIGLNHASTPVDVLERVTIAAPDLDKALDSVTMRPHVSEAVIVSTCNRTEIYVTAERFHGAYQDVRDFLTEQSFLPPEQLSDHLYTFYDDDAVRHLFEVSAGINSAVLGEHEILGQVKRAWQAAQKFGSTGTALNAVFRSALEVGKRVRTETSISRNIASVSQAAIVLAADRLGGLEGADVLLIGAGEMGTGMARTLAGADLTNLVVSSRTHQTALDIADEIGATVSAFDDLETALVDADVVFTSTAAPHQVIDLDLVQRVIDARDSRPLLFVDVALPRDVDPLVASIDGVTVCDLDTVGEFVSRGLADRAGELGDARAIVEAEVSRHVEHENARSLAPLITAFRNQAEQIRLDELQRQARHLDKLDAEQRQLVDDVTRALLSKLLHAPTTRLKESSQTLRGDRLAAAISELYDLG